MNTIFETLQSHPIIPIYYNNDIEKCIEVFERSYKAGIRVFEFVNRGEKAKENFQILNDYRNQHAKEMLLGIGTIKNTDDAKAFLELDADFLVSPIVIPEIAKIANEYNKVWIPGAMTPTEIALAERSGCKIIKIFPASTVGSDFLKSIKPLFSDLKFIVTGGISPNQTELEKWFDAGALAIGLGNSLFKDSDDNQNFEITVKKLLNKKE